MATNWREKNWPHQKAYKRRNRERIARNARTYRKLHPERVALSQRRKGLKKFGLTIEAYETLLITQGGVCAICKIKCSTGRNLAVDHDHKTNRVRGLLCTRCNFAIGNALDNPASLRLAAEYLERWS